MPAIILPVPHQQVLTDLAAFVDDPENPINLAASFKTVNVQPVLGGTRINCSGVYEEIYPFEVFSDLNELANRLSRRYDVTSLVAYDTPMDPEGKMICLGTDAEQTWSWIQIGLLARKAQIALGDDAVSITAPGPQSPRLSDWTDAVAWIATRPFSADPIDESLLTRCLEAGADLSQTDFMGVSLLDRVADKNVALALRLADAYPAKRRPSPG